MDKTSQLVLSCIYLDSWKHYNEKWSLIIKIRTVIMERKL